MQNATGQSELAVETDAFFLGNFVSSVEAKALYLKQVQINVRMYLEETMARRMSCLRTSSTSKYGFSVMIDNDFGP